VLKKLFIGIVIVCVVIVGLAATKPDSFTVVRTASIKAPPEKIFPLINDFHSWDAWSPWAKLDPAMKVTYGGAASGVGAVYEWIGNSDVGQGRMEITETTPSSKVGIKLDFLSPIEAHNLTVFDITPGADASTVTWTMSGPNTFMGKVMSVFVSMDKMIGGDFEKGLSQLKTASEK
jgi:hypothetical protein